MNLTKPEVAAIPPERGLLPWHYDQWQMLMVRLRTNTMPHALLLTGLRGLGKNRFADTLARALLCGQPQADGQACTVCRSCLLYQVGTHPDYLRVCPNEKGKAIVVDQIRAMNTRLSLKSQYGGHKLVIISPAEQMNAAAANSLLKTLEEPSVHSLLILITSQAALLPATVRSRCQQVKFTPPSGPAAIDWLSTQIDDRHNPMHLLALAGGAPLIALDMAASGALARRTSMLDDLERLQKKQADPVTVAAAWLQDNSVEALPWMQSCLMDMIRLKRAAHPPYLANPDLQQRLSLLAEHLSLTLIYTHLDCVTEAIRLSNRQVNTQLLLEDMLISWNDDVSQINYRMVVNPEVILNL